MGHEPERQSREPQEGHPPKPKPIVIRIFRTLKRQYHHCKSYEKKGEAEHQRNERMMARWARNLGYFTIVLAFIAAVTACILYKTDQTLQATLRANIYAERPVILIESLSVDYAPMLPKIHYQLRNYGKTIARLRKVVFCAVTNTIGYLQAGEEIYDPKFCSLPDQPGYIVPPGQPSPYMAPILLPGIGTAIGQTPDISITKLLEHNPDRPWIFIFGYLIFADSFDDRYVHRQNFCYFSSPGSPGIPANFTPTGARNCWAYSQEKAPE